MKHLALSLCIGCILILSHSIASAQDNSQQPVITTEDPVIFEPAYAESQTRTMMVPDTAPEAMPPRGPGIAQVVFLFLMFSFLAVVVVIGVILWCRIYSKTGYSWAFGLLMIIPIANFVMLCVLAFSDWPVLKEVKALRQQLQQRPPTSV